MQASDSMSSEAKLARPPLLLRSVEVNGLRTLAEAGPFAIQPTLTVITGPNGSGKTSLFDALRILLSGSAVPADAHRPAPDNGRVEIEVRARLSAPDSEDDDLIVRARLRSGDRIQREVLDLVHKGFGGLPTAMTIPQLKEVFGRLAIPDPTGNKSKTDTWTTASNEWLKSEPEQSWGQLWRPITAEETSRLPILEVFNQDTAANPQSVVESIVRREIEQLIVEQHHEPLALIQTAINTDIQPSLERIRETIHRYSDLEASVSTDLDFSRPNPSVAFVFTDSGGRESTFSQLGGGRQQRLTLAVHAANLESLTKASDRRASVLAYDEPDTHLDHGSQRELFDLLSEQANLPHVQVLSATHSSNFIDKVSLSTINHLRLDDQRKTIVDRLRDFSDTEEQSLLAILAAGIGPRNSSLLGEPCFFLVEGETEIQALQIFYRKIYGQSMFVDGIGIINASGSPAVRILLETLLSWNKTLIALVDEDAKTGKRAVLPESWLAKNGLREGKEVFFIGTKEFEDAFADELWIDAIESTFTLDDGSDWDFSTLPALRERPKYSTALRDFVSDQTGYEVIKPELGAALATTIPVADIPLPITACFTAAREVRGLHG